MSVNDPEPVFAAKFVAKRIATEGLMGWHGLRSNEVPRGTPLDPVEPAEPATLSELPDLATFAAHTPARDFALAPELANWLRGHTVFGSSHQDYRVLSTAETLEQARAGRSLLCGDITRFYIMLAPALGLVARIVYLWAPDEPNHVVAEVWSRDLTKWAIVDVQENMILTQRDVLPRNAVEVSDLVRAGCASEIQLVPNGE